jgi:hypothetical protein
MASVAQLPACSSTGTGIEEIPDLNHENGAFLPACRAREVRREHGVAMTALAGAPLCPIRQRVRSLSQPRSLQHPCRLTFCLPPFSRFCANTDATDMDDKDVLERLLEVLNRIDGRLKSIESSVATTKAAAPEQVEEGTALPQGGNGPRVLVESANSVKDGRDLERVASAVEEDPVAHNASSQKGKGIERPTQPETVLKPSSSTEPSKDVQTLDISPTAPIFVPQVEPHGEILSSIQTQIISPTAPTTDTSPQSEQHGEGASIVSYIGIHPQDQTGRGNDGLNDYYFKMLALDWVDLAKDESGKPRNSTPEMEALWAELFGIFWAIPPDNRVDLAFQKHVLLSLPHEKEEAIARSIGQCFSDRSWWDNLSFSITDFGNEGVRVTYQ